MRLRPYRLRLALAGVALCATTLPADAQSITNGSLVGTAVDQLGRPLFEVRVAITDPATGVSREMPTRQGGRFEFQLLAAGTYDILVEQLGYRPTLLQGVPVRPGRDVQVTVTIVETPPPVTRIDTVRFAGAASTGTRAGVSQWFSSFEHDRLAADRRALDVVARSATNSSSFLETEGLPSSFSGVYVDGVPYVASRNSALGTEPFENSLFARSAFAASELITNEPDVEWGGFGGGILSGYMRRGSREMEIRAFGDFTANALFDSRLFDKGDISTKTGRGGLLISGPIVRDTAHFVVGAEVQHLEALRPRAWALESSDASLLAEAATLGVDLTPYTTAYSIESDVISAFGRFDWQISEKHNASVRANFASVKSDNPDLGRGHVVSLGSSLDATDLSVGATLTSNIAPRFGNELRLGVSTSQRDYTSGDLVGTRVVDDAVAFGSDPALPGSFDRTNVHFRETVFIRLNKVQLKLGGGIDASNVESTFGYNRSGRFLFSDAQNLGAFTGVFEKTEGSLPVASYNTNNLFFYFQNLWNAAPGLFLKLGVRVAVEDMPDSEVRPNAELLAATGLDRTDIESSVLKASPRIGLDWDVQNRGEWLVRANWGLYYDNISTAVLGELLTVDGRQDARRGVGVLGAWPAEPDAIAAPVAGVPVTLLGPDFKAPRTTRVSAGVSRIFRDGTAIHISGTYRHTDFLPRRTNLNLAPQVGQDQYDRPVYGTLVQQGLLVTAEPGSNVRFGEFDLLSALNPDGFSDYYSGTFAVERKAGDHVRFSGSYTYSRTEDNWLQGFGGDPRSQLSPFPDSLDNRDWADGRSDFDIPHRATLGAEFETTGRVGLRLGVFYRFRSGLPYTPGFRTGVDVNGDGASNDVAFVDDGIAGIDAIIALNDCLADQVGGFAERNACRAPDVHTLDLRLGLRVAEFGGFPIEIVVDGLNLIESNVAVPERALYLVDPSGTLTVNPTTGLVTVPLIANGNFGEPIAQRTSGRTVRIGVRVNY